MYILGTSIAKVISLTPGKNHPQQQQLQHHTTSQQQQQQQQQSQTHTTLAAVAAAAAAVVAGGSSVTGSVMHNNLLLQQQQHTQVITLQGTTSAISSNAPGNMQSVIQATPTIAFSAVAKHNTCNFFIKILTNLFMIYY